MSLPIEERVGDLRAEVGILRDEVAATVKVLRLQTTEIATQLDIIERMTKMLLVLAKDYSQRKGG